MRKYMWLALMALATSAGCSVPDDPNWDVVVDGANAIPEIDRTTIARWEANKYFCRWVEALRSDRPDEGVIDIECNDSSDFGAITRSVSAEDMFRCVCLGSRIGGPGSFSTQTLDSCAQSFVVDYRAAHFRALDESGLHLESELDVDCTWDMSPAFSDAPVEEWDPKNHLVGSQLARDLVTAQAPPWWITMLGLTIVGGVLVATTGPGAALIPALCTFSTFPCPGNPNYPPGDTPQPQ